MTEHDEALHHANDQSVKLSRTREAIRNEPRPKTEPGALAGVAITTPVAEEIAYAAHQALRAFVAVMGGQRPLSPAWPALLPTEAATDRIKHVQRIAVGDADGWGQGSLTRDRVYSLVVMGILALGEDAGGNMGGSSARRVDLAWRVLGWLEDGEAMQVPVFGEILQVLSEHVTGDDDGAVGTARRLSEIAKQAEAMVAKASAEAGALRVELDKLRGEHNLVRRVLEPHVATEGLLELPHETISRLLDELASAKSRADEQSTHADHLLARAERAEAELRKVTAAIDSVPLSVRDRLSIHHSKEVGTAPAGKIATLGGLAMEGILNAQKAQGALDAQAVLEREMGRAPITVGGNTVLAFSPLLTERVKLLCKTLINSHEANAQRNETHEHYRAKALAWEELILYIAREVPSPLTAIVDAHGDDPERWTRWPQQVRKLISALLQEAHDQREMAELEARERRELEAVGARPALEDDVVVIALLRSARARLPETDKLCRVIDATLDMVDGEGAGVDVDELDEGDED